MEIGPAFNAPLPRQTVEARMARQEPSRFSHVCSEMLMPGLGVMRMRLAFGRHRDGDQASVTIAALGDAVIGEMQHVLHLAPQ